MTATPYKVIPKNTSAYEFESIGPKGVIKKLIEITPLNMNGFYNFGFGDYQADGSYDDLAESNNGDLIKVLSTIILVMEDFLNAHPFCHLYFEGSTPQRTNVYNLIVKRYYVKFQDRFIITGLHTINGVLTQVKYNESCSHTFEAFIIRKNSYICNT